MKKSHPAIMQIGIEAVSLAPAILWICCCYNQIFASFYCFIVALYKKCAHVMGRKNREWNKTNWIQLSGSYWVSLILFPYLLQKPYFDLVRNMLCVHCGALQVGHTEAVCLAPAGLCLHTRVGQRACRKLDKMCSIKTNSMKVLKVK